jgi:hypothetical protein
LDKTIDNKAVYDIMGFKGILGFPKKIQAPSAETMPSDHGAVAVMRHLGHRPTKNPWDPLSQGKIRPHLAKHRIKCPDF